MTGNFTTTVGQQRVRQHHKSLADYYTITGVDTRTIGEITENKKSNVRKTKHFQDKKCYLQLFFIMHRIVY